MIDAAIDPSADGSHDQPTQALAQRVDATVFDLVVAAWAEGHVDDPMTPAIVRARLGRRLRLEGPVIEAHVIHDYVTRVVGWFVGLRPAAFLEHRAHGRRHYRLAVEPANDWETIRQSRAEKARRQALVVRNERREAIAARVPLPVRRALALGGAPTAIIPEALGR